MTETAEATEAEPTPKRRRRRKADNGEARQYPDQKGLHQIETPRRRREPLDVEQTEAYKTREANGWTPQSEASGVFDSWWETADQ